MAPSNVVKIDLSEVTSASFIITLPNGEDDVDGQVQFFYRNRDSYAVETRQEDDKIYVKVTPRDEIIREQVVAPVEVERDGSTTITIKREEREAEAVVQEADANDILLTVGEDGLARNMRPEELSRLRRKPLIAASACHCPPLQMSTCTRRKLPTPSLKPTKLLSTHPLTSTTPGTNGDFASSVSSSAIAARFLHRGSTAGRTCTYTTELPSRHAREGGCSALRALHLGCCMIEGSLGGKHGSFLV
jgi:hypothetical protein